MHEHVAALVAEALDKSDLIDDVDHPRENTWHMATMSSTVLVRMELLAEQECLSFAAELDVDEDVEIPLEMLMNFNSLIDETGVFVSLDAEGGPLSVRRMITTRGISVGDIVQATEATAPKVLSLAAILPEAAIAHESESSGDSGSAGDLTMLRG
ncbi:MAG: hypothetical protein AAGC81_11485 [Pseudomonadota bacterium]